MKGERVREKDKDGGKKENGREIGWRGEKWGKKKGWKARF